MNILVVDDSRAMRMIVKRSLREAGFGAHAVVEARDGQNALRAVREYAPDVVISHWSMRDMSGIDLLRTLHDNGVVTKFGFVITDSSREVQQRATEAGAMFMIRSPFTAESFQTALRPILHA